MNGMNDQRFFDLAIKVIAGQATDVERAELDALVANQPELKAEFERLKTDAGQAKDVLGLLSAAENKKDELPVYVRGRLQTKVRQTLGHSGEAPRRTAVRKWGWLFGLAAAIAVIVLVALPLFHASQTPVIRLAMLDTVGGTRGGTDSDAAASFRQVWDATPLSTFTNADSLRQWETSTGPGVIKIVYARADAEVTVIGNWQGKAFEKTFPVESDLGTTLAQAKEFVALQTRR
jgi:hypothetical protein